MCDEKTYTHQDARHLPSDGHLKLSKLYLRGEV